MDKGVTTTVAVQRYLDELACIKGDSPAEPIVRDLLARWVDEHAYAVELRDSLAEAPVEASASSQTGPNMRRILDAIGDLPENEREAFHLVRLQGMSKPEAAEVIGVSEKTVKRRLNRGLLLLSQMLGSATLARSPAAPNLEAVNLPAAMYTRPGTKIMLSAGVV